uniref:MULE transposase domain-containing protein n=1 Tax=Plectus sambesii TaxID=2011161 RepID=A0A914XA81_9BILA
MTYYKYLLCTLMVLDEASGGQPVAELFIESESENDLIPLFQALKVRHPSLDPAYFMPDYASAFWNSWQKVFSGPETRTKHITCAWHIWRALNGQMQNGANKIGTAKLRRVVRQCLATLMNEEDEAEFKRKYENIFNNLWITGKENVKKFREYFLRYYPASTAHDWARFGRPSSDIATNMHLEAYHRVLKQRFLNRNYRNRLDVLLTLFINEVPLFYERRRCRVTVMDEIVTSPQLLANRDHDVALYYILNPTEIRIVDEDHWQVESRGSDVEKEPWDVRNLQKKCPSDCQMLCPVCGVCLHMYTCTCFKNTHESGRIACAHIHAVHYMASTPAADDEEDTDDLHVERLPVDSTDESVLDRTIEFVSSKTEADVSPSSSTQGATLKDAIAKAKDLKDQIQTWLLRHENVDDSASKLPTLLLCLYCGNVRQLSQNSGLALNLCVFSVTVID